uniref:Uncharacterized protein n=1 Tax=Avena sativa TaxID=4498 RepID=A0ACD6AIS7_AVESA
MASGSNGSRRWDLVLVIPGPIYNCSYCPRTFTNLHARGGHMTKHRREILEARRKHEEFMSKRANDLIAMDPLQPGRAFWRRYYRGQERLILFPILEYRDLADVNGGPSHDPMLSESMNTKDKEKRGKLQIQSVDLTLKM